MVIAAGIVLWESELQKEPKIRGENLSWWLEDNQSGAEDYKLAVADMDARCVRYLIRELDWQPQAAPGKIPSILPGFLGRFFHRQVRADHRARAASILGKLKPLSKPAIPALRKLAHSPVNRTSSRDLWARGEAWAALISLGDESLDSCIDQLLDSKNLDWKVAGWTTVCLNTNAAPAVPRLVQAFHASNDQEFRGRIAFPLRSIRSYPELSVPVLKSLLNHADKSVRFQAIVGLGNFGAKARPALPDLIVLLQSDPSHREILTNVLIQIDPEAAHRFDAK